MNEQDFIRGLMRNCDGPEHNAYYGLLEEVEKLSKIMTSKERLKFIKRLLSDKAKSKERQRCQK